MTGITHNEKLAGQTDDPTKPVSKNDWIAEHDKGDIADAVNTFTLATLNSLVSDATLDDSGDSRTPTAHDLSGALHNASTLANLNLKISDATLDDSSASRTPSAHDLAGAEHNADVLADLNAKISDATLLDTAAIQFKTGALHAAADHENAGSLEIRLDDLKATEDNTDLNASTTAHGLLPKLDNDDTHFLDGKGAWATPDHGSIGGVSANDHHRAPTVIGVLDYYSTKKSTTSLTLVDFHTVSVTIPAAGRLVAHVIFSFINSVANQAIYLQLFDDASVAMVGGLYTQTSVYGGTGGKRYNGSIMGTKTYGSSGSDIIHLKWCVQGGTGYSIPCFIVIYFFPD